MFGKVEPPYDDKFTISCVFKDALFFLVSTHFSSRFECKALPDHTYGFNCMNDMLITTFSSFIFTFLIALLNWEVVAKN